MSRRSDLTTDSRIVLSASTEIVEVTEIVDGGEWMTELFTESQMFTPGRKDGHGTQMEHWLKTKAAISSHTHSMMDTDLWIHRYKRDVGDRATKDVQHIMLVEIKSKGATLRFAQDDTIQVIDFMFRREASRGGFFVMPSADGHGRRTVRIWGFHVLRMSDWSPDASTEIWWDEKPIDEDTLVQILAFDRSPDTLRHRGENAHATWELQPEQTGRIDW